MKQLGFTKAKWDYNNPVLPERTLGIETDTNKIKIGNGVSRWSELEYLSAQGSGTHNGSCGFEKLDIGVDYESVDWTTVFPDFNNHYAGTILVTGIGNAAYSCFVSNLQDGALISLEIQIYTYAMNGEVLKFFREITFSPIDGLLYDSAYRQTPQPPIQLTRSGTVNEVTDFSLYREENPAGKVYTLSCSLGAGGADLTVPQTWTVDLSGTPFSDTGGGVTNGQYVCLPLTYLDPTTTTVHQFMATLIFETDASLSIKIEGTTPAGLKYLPIRHQFLLNRD